LLPVRLRLDQSHAWSLFPVPARSRRPPEEARALRDVRSAEESPDVLRDAARGQDEVPGLPLRALRPPGAARRVGARLQLEKRGNSPVGPPRDPVLECRANSVGAQSQNEANTLE